MNGGYPEGGPGDPARAQAPAVGDPGESQAGRAIGAVALGSCAAFGLAMTLAAAIGIAGQTRSIQNGTFVLAFAGLLPLAALVATRALRPPVDGAALPARGLAAALVLVAALGALRLAELAGAGTAVTGAFGATAGIAVALLAAALAERHLDPRPLSRLKPPRSAALAAGLGIVVLLIFAPDEVSAPAALVALTAAAVAWFLRRPGDLPRPRGALGIALDLGLLALVALLTIDVTGYWGPDFAVSSWSGLPPPSIGPVAQIHQHFYLGPVGDVLSGRTLLVDANSVYGIGNAYMLAGWFQIAPFGYGPFGLLGSLASVTMLAAGWGILRWSGVGRALAAVTLLVAVSVTVLAPITSPSLFLNVGGLRFAPPFLLLGVGLAVSGRDGPVSRSPWVLATFAFFSLWSFEALAYCGCAFLALALADAVPLRSLRRGALAVGRSLLYLLGTFLAAHLAFALLTLALGGELPDWGGYVELFGAWAEILEETFGSDAETFTRAWLLGAAYLASGVGAMLLLLGDEARRRQGLAIGGVSAIGASFLSYFIAHSTDVFLPFIALPALLLAALWLSLALREGGGQLASAALAIAACALVMLLAGSWSESERRLPRTALAHLVPGGPSLLDDMRRMWASPRIDPRAPAAQELIERHIPGDRALVLTEPDLGQEALIRAGRANLLPISYPWQDEVALEESLPPVTDAIAELEPGTRVLLQEPPGPGTAPVPALLFERLFGNVPDDGRLGPLAAIARHALEERFDLELVERGPDGLYVAELRPKGEGKAEREDAE